MEHLSQALSVSSAYAYAFIPSRALQRQRSPSSHVPIMRRRHRSGTALAMDASDGEARSDDDDSERKAGSDAESIAAQNARLRALEVRLRALEASNIEALELIERLNSRLEAVEEEMSEEDDEDEEDDDEDEDEWDDSRADMLERIKRAADLILPHVKATHRFRERSRSMDEEDDTDGPERLHPNRVAAEGVGVNGTSATIMLPEDIGDAGDDAGASVLEALLHGASRMRVDLREPLIGPNSNGVSMEVLSQFVELAVLPTAAAVENIDQHKSQRVKLVFNSFSQLSVAKKSMGLDREQAVAMDTLRSGKVEPSDRVIVLVAPEADGDTQSEVHRWTQQAENRTIIVFNPAMATQADTFKDYVSVYDMELLRVYYVGKDDIGDYIASRRSRGYVEESTQWRIIKDNGVVIVEEEDLSGSHSDDEAITAMLLREYPGKFNLWVQYDDLYVTHYKLVASFDERPAVSKVLSLIRTAVEDIIAGSPDDTGETERSIIDGHRQEDTDQDDQPAVQITIQASQPDTSGNNQVLIDDQLGQSLSQLIRAALRGETIAGDDKYSKRQLNRLTGQPSSTTSKPSPPFASESEVQQYLDETAPPGFACLCVGSDDEGFFIVEMDDALVSGASDVSEQPKSESRADSKQGKQALMRRHVVGFEDEADGLGAEDKGQGRDQARHHQQRPPGQQQSGSDDPDN
mmetsp:Transcript_29772/g.74074  ORF Transcript_29772/g.74074 Transcript_29772/m.74074 type:complete len:691 (-) Transcript_29772:64-2136(-)